MKWNNLKSNKCPQCNKAFDSISFTKRMTDQEILRKAIIKAFGKVRELRFNQYTISYRSDFDGEDAFSVWASKETLVFSHKFAKAFWKNINHLGEIGKGHDFDNGWQFHLKKMVLEENPIDYLARFL